MSFVSARADGLEYLRAGGISASHAFTTRSGGVSAGHLESLNLGIHRGDRPANVLENHRRLCAVLGCSIRDLVFTRQIHTDTVRVVTRGQCGQGLFFPAPDCDALVTADGGVALAAFSADCPLILLHDPDTGAVGAVHSGWRGTALGIARRAVETMAAAFGSRPERLRAAIGPCIGPCCFETRCDVPDAMLRALGTNALPAITVAGDRYHVDLRMLNETWLRLAGVEQVECSSDCTACQPDRFWSHRRVGERRGVQAAVIVCPSSGGCL